MRISITKQFQQKILRENITRICVVCFSPYTPTQARQKSCKDCKKKGKNIQAKEWRTINKDSLSVKRRTKDQTAKGKERYLKYRNTEKYKKYSRERYEKMDEDKKVARRIVIKAVRDGYLVRSEYCDGCGRKDWGIGRSMIEAHHFMGYTLEYALQVEWLCTNCHKLAELEDRERRAE